MTPSRNRSVAREAVAPERFNLVVAKLKDKNRENFELKARLKEIEAKITAKARRNLSAVYGQDVFTDEPMMHRGDLQKVLANLAAIDCEVRWDSRTNSGMARCPAHEDRLPSLKVAEAESGKILVRCFAGCSTPAVLEAAGLTWADLCDTPPRFWKS